MSPLPPTARTITLGDGRVLTFSRTFDYANTLNGGRGYLADDGLAVIESTDMTPRWGPLRHVSMSYPDHNPDWETIKLVRDAFFGDVDCMMVLPKSKDWVNRMDFCFHLWKTPEKWGLR